MEQPGQPANSSIPNLSFDLPLPHSQTDEVELPELEQRRRNLTIYSVFSEDDDLQSVAPRRRSREITEEKKSLSLMKRDLRLARWEKSGTPSLMEFPLKLRAGSDPNRSRSFVDTQF
ncbi:hypothetical protein PanWU01x14_319510 [Parasponia andersonii]|uniref:Uncharacterized protein n=1 Tax=Parasponia andersonii TaxID=3476 RepID=A0A2P5ALX7_PARAD|nr:hypothetical protein PanWU01x14_319510 [Parasponia andersonii]